MYRNHELTNIIIHPLNAFVMFALIFLYALIISAIIGAVILVLKLVLWAVLWVVLWIGFSIANLVERRKKAVRQRRQAV